MKYTPPTAIPVTLEDLLDNQVHAGIISLENFRHFLRTERQTEFYIDFHEAVAKYTKQFEEFEAVCLRRVNQASSKNPNKIRSAIDFLRSNRSLLQPNNSKEQKSFPVIQNGGRHLSSTNDVIAGVPRATPRKSSQNVLMGASGDVLRPPGVGASMAEKVSGALKPETVPEEDAAAAGEIRQTPVPKLLTDSEAKVSSSVDSSTNAAAAAVNVSGAAGVAPASDVSNSTEDTRPQDLARQFQEIYATYIVREQRTSVQCLTEAEFKEIQTLVTQNKNHHPEVLLLALQPVWKDLRENCLAPFVEECFHLMYTELFLFRRLRNAYGREAQTNGLMSMTASHQGPPPTPAERIRMGREDKKPVKEGRRRTLVDALLGKRTTA